MENKPEPATIPDLKAHDFGKEGLSSEPIQPQPANIAELRAQAFPTAGLSVETREVLQFVSQESEKTRRYFSFIAKLTTGAIGLVLTIAVGAFTWFGMRTLDETRTQVRGLAETEVNKMRSEVRDRIDQEFKTDNIRGVVTEAARTQSQSTLVPLMHKEVFQQVHARVSQEQATIKLTVENETKKAVRTLEPTVSSLVKTAVQEKVDEQVKPISQQLNDFQGLGFAASLAVRALSGDAQAFDQLIPLTNLPESDQRRQIATSAVNSVFVAHNKSLYESRTFNDPQSRDQLLQHLADKNPLVRKAALDTLGSQQPGRELIPSLVQVMLGDPDLDVRESAYRVFNNITRARIDNLNPWALGQWLQKNPDVLKRK